MISAYSPGLVVTEFDYCLVYPLASRFCLLFSAKLPQLYLVRRCWEEQRIALSECDPAENAFTFANQLINSIKLHNVCRDLNALTEKTCIQMSGTF